MSSPKYDQYSKVLQSHNFIGGAGKDIIPDIANDPRDQIATDLNGVFRFNYFILSSLAEMNQLGYYDTPQNDIGSDGIFDREYNELPYADDPSVSNVYQIQIISSILNSSTYGSSFSDVANVQFDYGSVNNANIVFGQTTSGGDDDEYVSNLTGAYELDVSLGDNSLVHGDIWINKDFNSNEAGLGDWIASDKGSTGHSTIMHELAHSLGLGHTADENDIDISGFDNQRYSIMSYVFMAGMDPVGDNNEVTPFGLQLMDIAALQEIYGRNYTTRTGDTEYSKITAFSSSRPNDAFIYTIWDGAGNDTIDASGYDVTAQIDLRQGHFSSIGLDADGDDIDFDNAISDNGNLAIAFHTIIENAIGTSESDILIGNAWSNRLEGGAGNDTLYGDGEEYDGERGFTDVDAENPDGYAPASDNDTFIGGQGNDTIYGGGGSDTVDYSKDTGGVTVFLGEDEFLTGDHGSAFDGWGNEDTLWSIENITGSAFDDRFNIGSPVDEASRTFDGGEGVDKLSYAFNAYFLGNEFRVVVDSAAGKAHSLHSSDSFLNIEDFDNVTYLADISSGHTFAFGQESVIFDTDPYAQPVQSVITTYAHATQAGEFVIEGKVQAATTFVDDIAVAVQLTKIQTVTVEFGSVVHEGVTDGITFDITDQSVIDQVQYETGDGEGYVYESYNPTTFYMSTLVGTNHGDTVYLNGLGDDAGIKFIAGKGNDQIIADAVTSQFNGYSTSSVEVVYTGGVDTISGNLGMVSFAEYITASQISVSGYMTDGYLIGDGVITISGLGSITIDVGQYDPTFIAIPSTSSTASYDPLLYSLTYAAQTLTGGTGADNLVGSFGVDTIAGGAGVDRLYGAAGNDVINGDAGNDEIFGGVGNDTINGGSDVDTLFGNAGDDTLTGGSGNDILDGGPGNDAIDGGADTDTITYANAGGAVRINLGLTTAQDTGGGGVDTITNVENVTGSDYNDTIEGNAGSNVLNGGDGKDTVTYANATGAVSVEMLYATVYVSGSGTDTISGFENVTGSNFNDTFYAGTSTENVFTGLGGDDLFYYSAGNDTYDGGDGIDSISYFYAPSALNVNLLNGATSVGANTQSVYDIEILYGSGYNDIITGGAGIDTLTYASAAAGITISLASTSNQVTGGAGTDKISAFENLIGSAHNDTLTGSSGANLIEGGLGDDNMNGGSGVDTLDYSRAGSAITLSLALTSAQNTGGAGTDTITAFENILGSAYNDNLTGSSAANLIEGGAGDDYMDGGTGTDTLSYTRATSGVTVSLALTTAQITGGAGTDTVLGFENLTGSAFDDVLTGSTAANVMEGGLGNDTINGGAGTDTLTYANAGSGVTVSLAITTAQNTSGAGTDIISNFERLTGSAYDDTLSGNSAANTIDGGLGNDRIFADAGNDTLNGNTGIDTLDFANIAAAITVNLATTSGQATGGAGTDTYTNFENVSGTSMADTITGNTLANILNGRGGADTLTGGTGADTFFFDTSGLGNVDTVTDFATAQGDKLDISNLLFSFDPLQNLLDDYVSFATSGSNSIMSVDRDGTGSVYSSQAVASLTGVTGLDADTLYSSGNLIA